MIFKVLSVIILIVFYLSYFIKQLILSKKGIKANQLGKGVKPKQTFVIEIFLKTFSFLIIAAEICSIFYSKLFLDFKPGLILKMIGVALAFLGVIVFMISMVAMKNNWRAGINGNEKTILVQTGIYKLSRNPAFVGFYFVYIGICLAFANLMLVCITLMTILVFHLQVLEEEKYLEKTFKEDYIAYKKKVRRYF